MKKMDFLTEQFTRASTILLDHVSKKYKIDRKKVEAVWKSCMTSSNKSVPPLLPSTELTNMSRQELVAQCKLRGLPVSGTKAQLIEKLTGGKPPAQKESKTSSKKSIKSVSQPKVISSLIKKNKEVIKISKNEFGNNIHEESGIVFKDGIAVGTQNEKGKIVPLTKQDVETCNKYKFTYDMPENLLNKKTLVEEEEEEIEEDEEIVEEEIEVEEDVEETEEVEEIEEVVEEVVEEEIEEEDLIASEEEEEVEEEIEEYEEE